MAQKGGNVAKAARLQLENAIGKKLVTRRNARHLDDPKRVEEIENRLTKQVRYLEKLVDELAKVRKMEKILRVG